MTKLYEHIILHRLNEEIEEKNVISNHQFGFRKEKTTIQPMKIVKEIIYTIRKKAYQH